MKATLLIGVILVAQQVCAQDAGKKPMAIVERLCGKLEHVQDIPVKGTQNTFETRTRSLRGVLVTLYADDDKSQTAQQSDAVARTTTGRWGNFRLKEKQVPPGVYRLVVEPIGRKYEMLIRYDPKRNSGQLCSNSFWQLNDDGKFWKTETIFVD